MHTAWINKVSPMAADLFFSQALLDFSGHYSRPTFGLTRPYLEHQVASDLFGQYDDRPFLFRSDLAQGATGTLLVLSTEAPRLPKPDSSTFGLVSDLRTTTYPTHFQAGTTLDFELRLNATVDIPLVPGKRSKRIDIWEHARRLDSAGSSIDAVYGDYLKRRLTHGTQLLTAKVTERSFLKVGRRGKGGAPISFVATNVIGTLRVTDPPKFSDLLASGVGRAKGFGCGMLCLSAPGTVLPRRHPAMRLVRDP